MGYLSFDYEICWIDVKFEFEIFKRFNGFIYRYFSDP